MTVLFCEREDKKDNGFIDENEICIFIPNTNIAIQKATTFTITKPIIGRSTYLIGLPRSCALRNIYPKLHNQEIQLTIEAILPEIHDNGTVITITITPNTIDAMSISPLEILPFPHGSLNKIVHARRSSRFKVNEDGGVPRIGVVSISLQK